ncbi:MAG: histidine kinase [Bacteroidetes bacterium]|nr:histidine kinase [Bacteroidota bacterium]
MNTYYKLIIFTALIFCGKGLKAQISDSLYSILPANLKPADPKALSRNEKMLLLKNAGTLPVKFWNEFEIFAEQIAKDNKKNIGREQLVIESGIMGNFYKIYAMNSKMPETGYARYRIAINYFKRVIELGESMPEFHRVVSDAYSYLSFIYIENNVYDSASFFSGKCINNSIQYKDSLSLFGGYCLLADLYMIMDSMDRALNINSLAIQLVPQDWEGRFLDRHYFKMRCYKTLYEQTKNMSYVDTAKKIADDIFQHAPKQSSIIYRVYEQLGKLYFAMKMYRKSILYLDSSLAEGQSNTNLEYLAVPGFMRELCLIRLGNKARIEYLLDSIPAGSYNTLRLLYEELYQQAVDENEWQNAYLYYREYNKYKDSLKISDVNRHIKEAEQKYEAAEKQARIAALENKSLIRQKEQRKIITVVVGVAFFFLVALGFVAGMYRYLHIKRKSEVQLLSAELYNVEAAIHDEKLQQQELVNAQRKKIAEDMHDEVSSGLAAFRFYIIDLKSRANNEETALMLSTLESEAQVLYQHVRTFMHNLNTDSTAAGYHVCELADQLSARFNNKKLLAIHTLIDRSGVEEHFTGDMHHELYLVIKEAVANSIKHAGASLIQISISFNDQHCFFAITDNGKGFKTRNADTEGIGLKSMASRIHAISGDFTMRTGSQGTVVEGSFPV